MGQVKMRFNPSHITHPAHDIYLAMRRDDYFLNYSDEEIFTLIYRQDVIQKFAENTTYLILFALALGFSFWAQN